MGGGGGVAPHNSQLVRLGRVPRVDHEALAQTRVRGNDRKVIARYGQNGSNVHMEWETCTDRRFVVLGERALYRACISAGPNLIELLTLR